MTIEDKIKSAIRDIPDFPKPGILFKDITPIFLDAKLCKEIVNAFIDQLNNNYPDAILAVESRGFLFGPMIAQRLNIPFIPVRKKGKLPGETISKIYDLEYGTAEIEIHKGHLKQGWNVMIHDDLLATGGTASAAAELAIEVGCSIHSFSFMVNLSFLNGEKKLSPFSEDINSLVIY